MKKVIIKSLSWILALLMVLTSLSVCAGAIDIYYDAEGHPDYEKTMEHYLSGVKFETKEEKLASMELMWESNGYALYADSITGEVATVKVATGEILFTNPWDISDASYTAVTAGKKDKTTSLSVKQQLLSQLVVKYTDNGAQKVMYSSTDAAMRNQIKIEYIKNGIRVEYSIGREETRMLVPRMIEQSRFETMILQPMREYFQKEENAYDYAISKGFDMSGPADPMYDAYYVQKVAAFFVLKDQSKALTDKERSDMARDYPITSEMSVYVLETGITTAQMLQVERLIKQYAPSYTFEELDKDHEQTKYVANEKAPALFKMALEYTIDEQGLVVRLPANGIRYDESLYKLESIEMLPYMGAGANDGDFNDGGDGYVFFPDGSGTLFDFQQLNTGLQSTFTSKVYGQDYAYHTISGKHQETIRYPAFGVVSFTDEKKVVPDYTVIKTDAEYDDNGNVVKMPEYGTKTITESEKRGYLAVIEEGDAMAEISSTHLSSTTIYNAVKMIFYPRPKDSYNMSDAISVGSNTTIEVTSKRKYVGNYKVRYFMLSDDELAKEAKLDSYYECSWMGMAVAYRDYLEKIGVISRLTETNDDIPLYIESYGALQTTEKILSIPVDVMTPLTTFENVGTMYSELASSISEAMKKLVSDGESVGTTSSSAEKFNNIKFKLTGFANGGMTSTVPYHLNWESAVGGASGFKKLVAYAKEEGFGVFPDFDFVYINKTDIFDGVDLKSHAVKTIDNRYTSRREWSATYQTYMGYYQLAIAPSSYDRFVSKLTSNYMKYEPVGISVSTLGSDLNSDFNEDNPLNREDSKEYTIDALKKISELTNNDGNKLEVMTDGGNAYTWKYVDYVLNMPLNSSRFNKSSNSVPFIGVVLHGYVNFAGTPINEEGDIEYAFLKAVENGASIYFTLAYQNTQKLKEDSRLSQHYSIIYDIWKDDLVELYVELNDLLCDLQDKLIIGHEFLTGERIPDADEMIADAEEAEAEAAAEAEASETAERKQQLAEALEIRKNATKQKQKFENYLRNASRNLEKIREAAAEINISRVNTLAAVIGTENEAEYAEEIAEYRKLVSEIDTALATIRENLAEADNAIASAEESTAALKAKYDAIAADENASEDEKLSAGQFYETSKNDTDELKSLVSQFKSTARDVENAARATAILRTKVNLFGNEIVDNAAQTVSDDVAAFNMNKERANAALDAIISNRETINNSVAAYLAAKEEFDNGGLTDERFVELTVIMAGARTAIRKAGTAIKNAFAEFKETYRSMTSYGEISESVDKIAEYVDYASKISSSNLSKFRTAYNQAKATRDGVKSEFEAIINKAISNAVINENYDLADPDDVDSISKELFSDKAAANAEPAYETTKYTVSDGTIVAVTYGGKNGKDSAAYRTFLLNYNSFKVSVNYGGVNYELPEYGYVAINY